MCAPELGCNNVSTGWLAGWPPSPSRERRTELVVVACSPCRRTWRGAYLIRLGAGYKDRGGCPREPLSSECMCDRPSGLIGNALIVRIDAGVFPRATQCTKCRPAGWPNRNHKTIGLRTFFSPLPAAGSERCCCELAPPLFTISPRDSSSWCCD